MALVFQSPALSSGSSANSSTNGIFGPSGGYIPNGDSLAMLLGNSIQPMDNGTSDGEQSQQQHTVASMMTPLPLQLLNQHQQARGKKIE